MGFLGPHSANNICRAWLLTWVSVALLLSFEESMHSEEAGQQAGMHACMHARPRCETAAGNGLSETPRRQHCHGPNWLTCLPFVSLFFLVSVGLGLFRLVVHCSFSTLAGIMLYLATIGPSVSFVPVLVFWFTWGPQS